MQQQHGGAALQSVPDQVAESHQFSRQIPNGRNTWKGGQERLLASQKRAEPLNTKPALWCWQVSEEVGLLHDAQELLLVDLAVTIAVGLIDHLLQLLICHAFAQLLGHSLQILEGDAASLIVVEESEGLQDLVLRVAVQDLVGHHLQELLVTDGAAAVVIDVRDHLLDLLLLGLETQGAHRDLQLLGVDLTRSIGIEQIEGLLDLLLLLLSQLLLLLSACIEASESHDSKEGVVLD
mmetsp:Transcript_67843/g.147829  ORF Transcript_67843/g.147829 Transcript_67843/m.147829 type:complete len:236 (-) Transcript_67843:56-763(-)